MELNSPNGLSPHNLELKVNCPIILLKSVDPANDLCNGTKMVYRNFCENVIYAEITMGQHIWKQVFLSRIPLSLTENEGIHFSSKKVIFSTPLLYKNYE